MLDNLKKYSVVLASGSPRRRELLSMLGIPFTVKHGIEVDESWPEELPAEEVAPYLAGVKADVYSRYMSPEDLLITADTVVICDGKILGKPESESEACAMLHMLSGHTHKVMTGVSVLTPLRRVDFSSTTDVTFALLSDNEIEEYVRNFRPLDKAGAYGIQESIGAIAVSGINGSFYNVMGLPVHKLYEILCTF